MRKLRALWMQLRSALGLSDGAADTADLEAELQSHLDMHIEDNLRAGMSPAEARRHALVKLGGVEQTRQALRDGRTSLSLETILQDVRFALRVLRHSPGFTAVAVLTLAIGVGANTVVFSVLNALILRPLHVPHAESLYVVEQASKQMSQQSYPDYRDLRDRNRSLDSLVAYKFMPVGLTMNGHASKSWTYEASGNYFDALDVQPYLGRFFHATDEHGPNSSPYLVLGYAFWRSRFSGDPQVIGRPVQLNKFPFTVIGVAPPTFRGTELFFTPDAWVPIVDEGQVEGWNDLDSRLDRNLWMMGRLKPGVSPAQATADLNRVAAELQRAYPKEDDGLSFAFARPGLLGNTLRGPVRAFTGGLMLLSSLILLAACANLGSLFAARAADRSKEVALRLALGSSRIRIVRQLLTEACLVSLAGGVVGLGGGLVLLRLLSAWHPVPNMPVNIPVSPDARTYAVALLLALGAGLFFGLVPLRQVLRTDPYRVIKAGATGGKARRWSLRDLLLAVQIAVCAVLVTASFVAVRGLERSLHANYGFSPQGVVLAATDLDMSQYNDATVPAMQRRMLQAIADMPGVSHAAMADTLPLQLDWNNMAVYSKTATDLRESKAAAHATTYDISPDYFATAGTHLLYGRELTWHDEAHTPRVAVVNVEFARKLFGSAGAAVGDAFKDPQGRRIEVIGVVEDGRYMTLAEAPRPAMFRPMLQSPTSQTTLLVRSARNPQQLAADIDRTLHSLDPGLPLTIGSWSRELDTALFPARAATAALGRVFRLLAFGSVAGLLLGIGAGRVLSSIVYQATPRDPLVLSGVVLTMLLVGVLAAWIPAQRALAADPLLLLREE